jgi:hypothetical protein
MRIAALTLHDADHIAQPSRLEINVADLDPGLNVLHGPPACGKTALADLVGHAICGRRFAATLDATTSTHAPEGEVVVESRGHHYRLRRQHDATGTERLTIAALDDAPVDSNTVRELVFGLSPSLIGPIFTVNFREPLRPERLLAGPFAEEFRTTFGAEAKAADVPPHVAEIRSRIRTLERELTTLVAALGYHRRARPVIRQASPVRENPQRASNFLAKLTDGELTRVAIRHDRRGAYVANRRGNALALETISAAQRDQVYLSICLALVSACAECGVRLPLVLDEPFVRLDRRASAALIAVLHDVAREQQVLVFTARQEAVERFAKLGATTHDLAARTHHAAEPAFTVVTEAKTQAERASEQHRTTRVVRKKRRRAG